MGRLEEALNLIKDELPPDKRKIVEKVLDLDLEINCMDYNDWEDFYEDDSDSGLITYLRDLFEIVYK